MSGSNHFDAIVVGAGVDGLAAAAYLARGGLEVLVCEKRARLGGRAVTEEVFPGFRVDVCRHDAGWLPPPIVRELGLARHGLALATPETNVFAPLHGGGALTLHSDPARTRESVARHSEEDAKGWTGFSERMRTLAGLLEGMYRLPPPDLPEGRVAELLPLLRLGLRVRGLGRGGMTDLLRTLPMSIAEVLDEAFEGEALKGVLAAAALPSLSLGPMARGTGFAFLHHHAGEALNAFRSPALPRGGVGALVRALEAAARGSGAEIRAETPVERIMVREGRARGVALATGEEILSSRVLSAAGPQVTLLGLVDSIHLDPEFLRAVGNIRMRGATAKVNLALGELPRFRGVTGEDGQLSGAISIGPGIEYLERASDAVKYGEVSGHPYLEARIPTLHDPSLAPKGAHVMSVMAQYAPYSLSAGKEEGSDSAPASGRALPAPGAWGNGNREALADLVVGTLGEYAPNLPGAVLHRQVLTPADLERDFGASEGNLHHGELTLDQILFMRPVPGWSRYATPVAGLYLAGPGTHPGGGISGLSGRNAAGEVLRVGGR